MKESANLWSLLRDALPGVSWTRLETGTKSGVPDVNGCFRGVDFWIELKIRRDGKISLRKTQRNWILDRTKQRAKNIFILVRFKNELSLYSGNLILDPTIGDSEEYFYFSPESGSLLARTKKPFDWELLMVAILTRLQRKSGDAEARISL